MAVLEVCCYSMTCARETECRDAGRIGFRTVPREERLTPSYGVLVPVRGATTLLVYPIVCSCGGDFCHTEKEFVAMSSDICMVRELDFPGVVIDAPNTDGQIGILRMKKIMAVTRPPAVTFYRASDLCADLCQVRKVLGKLGVKHILTSGQ